jgi:hypothetical protein
MINRGEIDIKAGTHVFEFKCSGTRDLQKMKLSWIPPGAAAPVIIPNEVFLPE